jgi:hypothetical protein
MLDIREDIREAEDWRERSPDDAEMDIDELINLAIYGFQECAESEYCGSREYCGSESCLCIRANFATPEHYFLYLEMRRFAKRVMAALAVAEIATGGS